MLNKVVTGISSSARTESSTTHSYRDIYDPTMDLYPYFHHTSQKYLTEMG